MIARKILPSVAIRVSLVVLLCGGVRVTAAEKALPKHAIAQIGSYQFYHGPDVHAVISPDGKRIASVGHQLIYSKLPREDFEKYERMLILWDASTGERLHEIEVPDSPVSQPKFSPDGRFVAVGYGQAIIGSAGIAIYDVATGKIQTNIEQRKINLVGFSSDGKSLLFSAGGERDLIISWDIQKAEEARRAKHPEGLADMLKKLEYVWRKIPSSDAKYIATLLDVGPDYSTFPRDPFIRVSPHIPRPTVLVISDGDTGKILYRKEFPEEELDRFVFSSDGKQFVTSGKKVTFHDTATGKELFSLDVKEPYAVTLSPNGRWALINSSGSVVQLWNLETKKFAHELFSSKLYIPSHADFSADGKRVVLTTLTSIRVFETATGKEALSPLHRSQVTPRFSDDGKTFLTTCHELRQSWDISNLTKPTMLKSTPRNTWEGVCGNLAGGHSDDGRFFVGGYKDEFAIKDTATGKVIHKLPEDGWSGQFSVFSHDSTKLAIRRELWERPPGGGISSSNEPESLWLYDTRTGKKTGSISLKNGLVWVVPTFSKDGKMLAWADRTGDVHLHDGINGKPIRTLHSEKKLIEGECRDANTLFSGNGEYLIVTASRHGFLEKPDDKDWEILPTRVFQVSTGKEISRFYTNPETKDKSTGVSCVASSPNGSLVAFAEKESGTIRLFDALAGKMLAELKGHRHGVHAMTFSPDGKTLASGGEDGVAYLWDVTEFVPKAK